MKLARSLMLTATMLFAAGTASAVPVTFTFESAEIFDAGFTVQQTFTPSLPLVGSGDVDEAAGTYDLTLPDFSITLDIVISPNDGDDARLDTTGWGQVGTFAAGVGGDLTSSSATGNTTCTVLGGIGGLVCADFPAPVDPWPPTGDSGPTLGAPSATIDILTNTIVVISDYDANGGQVRSIYSYEVPEPGTILLVGAGLCGLLLAGRRRA